MEAFSFVRCLATHTMYEIGREDSRKVYTKAVSVAPSFATPLPVVG